MKRRNQGKPSMAGFSLIATLLLLSVIALFAGSEKVIVSSGAASLIACRSEPARLSFVFVTVRVAAPADTVRSRIEMRPASQVRY